MAGRYQPRRAGHTKGEERMMKMEKQIPGMDRAAQAYFNTLPVLLQEQIIQSGAKLCTKGQLESYCKNSLTPEGWKNLTESSGQ